MLVSGKYVVLRHGLRPTVGYLGRCRVLRHSLEPLGREHVWGINNGDILAAVRMACPRLPSPPGMRRLEHED